MNTQSVALLSILSKCDPSNTDISRESRFQRILHDNNYRELAHRSVFKPVFDKSFSEEVLRTYSDEKLAKVESALPYAIPCVEDILYSLQNGGGPGLCSEDQPDFLDANSMKSLSTKLSSATGKNFTNISPSDFMDIFSEKTIKSAENYFLNLPCQAANVEDLLPQLFNDEKYCISEKEIIGLEDQYQKEVNDYNNIIENGHRKRAIRRMIKLVLGLFIIFIPSFYAALTGALSANAVGFATLGEVLLAILLWILG